MKLYLPAINEREEVAPDEEVHGGAESEDCCGDHGHDRSAGQQSEEELGVAVAQAIKPRSI